MTTASYKLQMLSSTSCTNSGFFPLACRDVAHGGENLINARNRFPTRNKPEEQRPPGTRSIQNVCWICQIRLFHCRVYSWALCVFTSCFCSFAVHLPDVFVRSSRHLLVFFLSFAPPPVSAPFLFYYWMLAIVLPAHYVISALMSGAALKPSL